MMGQQQGAQGQYGSSAAPPYHHFDPSSGSQASFASSGSSSMGSLGIMPPTPYQAPAAVAMTAPAPPSSAAPMSRPTGSGGGRGSKAPVSSWKEISDQVRSVVLLQQQDELQNRSYARDYGQELATTIGERCLLMVREITGEEFKLSINSIIQEKKDVGASAIHVVSTNYWDSSADGSVVSKWENKSIVSIVTVYGIKA
jgi:Tctex-1 family